MTKFYRSFMPCLTAVMIAGVVGSGAALASPAKPASLEAAAQRGARIFATDSFGGKRMVNGQPATCASCHSNGGRTQGTMPNGAHIPSLIGVAAQFPKFIPQKHKVITLEEQLAHCIQGGLQGKPPAYNSPQMVDLITYLTSLSKSAVIGKQFK